jgi:hypothetical protein
MGFGQAHVARTAHAKALDPLRERAFDACSLIVKKGPVRLTVARSGRLQGVIRGIGSQLNGPAFHARTLRTHGTGPTMLARKLDKHAGLAFFQRLK